MKAHFRIVIFAMLVLVASRIFGAQEEPEKPGHIDGVYMLCEEVAGFSGEALELKDGKFRYWFYSDVGGDKTKYPLIGTYVVKEEKLLLQNPEIHPKERILSTLNGHSVVWRDDGLKLWREQKRIHPYAVLIRASGDKVDDPWANRPSVKLLYDQEMIRREEEEYQTRYHDQEEPVRSLLRALTQRDDPGLKEYASQIRKARANLNDRILRQLIARMGYENTVESIQVESILSELYESSKLIPEKPPFIASEKTLHESLNLLVEAMSEAKDREALTSTLILFLRVSRIGKMDLPIPEVGIRIRIGVLSGGGFSEDASRIQGSKIEPKDYRWKDEIAIIKQECQKWCRSAIKSLQKTANKPAHDNP